VSRWAEAERNSVGLDSVDTILVEDRRVTSNLGLDLLCCLGFKGEVSTLLLVVDGGLDLSLGLQGRDHMLVLPPDLMGETAKDAEFAVRFEAKDTEGRRDNMPLPLVIRGRDPLIGTVPLHGILSTGQLVGQHTTDCTVKDTAGSSVMEWAPLWVDIATLA